MRKSKLSASEIEAQQLAEHQERSGRRDGFSMMTIRDRGWVRLSNGSVFEWPVERELGEGEARTHVPEGTFILDGKLYDVDEFRKWQRWA
jgi:hypothetical protein